MSAVAPALGARKATRVARLFATASILAALAYLTRFVDRGWVAHDEGQLGQSAVLALGGALPHVGFQEAYTGALSQAYALVFAIFGVDLLHIRWVLFVGAAGATVLVYAISRRFLAPVAAASAACVALLWSFPNYFAGLPSWWLLIAALASVWLLIRYDETDTPVYLLGAGLVVGTAVVIKQTGLYLVLAALMATSFTHASSTTRLSRWLPRFVAVGVVLFVVALLKERLLQTEGAFLSSPVAACAVALWRRGDSGVGIRPDRSIRALALLSAAVALPILLFVAQYAQPDHFMAWLDGAFVQPRLRLGFATERMPAALDAGRYAAPLLGLVLVGTMLSSRIVLLGSWLIAIVLPVLALSDWRAYQSIWQSARVAAVLLPVLIAWKLRGGDLSTSEATRRADALLFTPAAFLALFSLNQHPFAGAIYFLYTAPLVLVCGIALARACGVTARALAPWGVLLALFALLVMNRGYIVYLGVSHEPVEYHAPLDLPRAHLRVDPADAARYRRVAELVTKRLRGGRMVAGPDSPEVYFLTGGVSPHGLMYEFMSIAGGRARHEALDYWKGADVVVLNHRPSFSPEIPVDLMGELRREYPSGETVDQFEVRWR